MFLAKGNLSPLVNVRVYILSILLFLSFKSDLLSQGLTGIVYNSENESIPYVNIYIRELESGTTSDESGYYYYQMIPGNYTVVYSAIGYETISKDVKMGDVDQTLDIYMDRSKEQLEEVMIKASRRDPAFQIIQNVIDNKKSIQRQLYSFTSTVYVKAYEDKLDSKVKLSSTETEMTEESISLSLSKPEEAAEDSIQDINLLEVEMTLHYQYPDLYKEERTALNEYGDQSGLFLPVFGETNFNIYDNSISLKGISDVPLISPLSSTAILSYKYKLESTEVVNERLVYKIKVIPRKKGNATCSGHIYVNDSTWNVSSYNLDIYKGALKFHDAFNIKFDYTELENNAWLPLRREFTYKTKYGRFKSNSGQTLILFSNFEKDVEFPDKFFGNELAITTREAYEKDSTFWNQARPEPLSPEQMESIEYSDSVAAYLDSPEYKDSIQHSVNRIELLDLVWDGLTFQNWRRKERMFVSHLPALWSYNVIGGFRIGPFLSYGRRYESGRSINLNTALNVGINRRDVNGRVRVYYTYDPYHLGTVRGALGRDFRPILSNDAILNQINPNNWVQVDFYELRHRRELFNGFYLGLGFKHNVVRAVADEFALTPLDSFFLDINAYEITEPLLFDDYGAFSTTINIDYTPGQRYMSEPDRKVVLGSKWPTFGLAYRKGWNSLLKSISDYDYLEMSMRQNLIFGPLGNSKYDLRAGSFLKADEIPFMDIRRFPRSNPYIFVSPLKTFQLLDTALATENLFIELHHIHHFNGALVNNIPLVKKLGIGAVLGGGFLWAQDADFNHSELFAGLERTFKLGPRRRLRLGVYGLTAKSSEKQIDGKFKFSIDIIDTWKKDWSF